MTSSPNRRSIGPDMRIYTGPDCQEPVVFGIVAEAFLSPNTCERGHSYA